MKKVLLFALAGVAVAGVVAVVRRAQIDMQESEDLWSQIIEEVDAQIAEAEATEAPAAEASI